MSTLNLSVKDLGALSIIQKKISRCEILSPEEEHHLDIFLQGLPSAESLLEEQFPLEKSFETKIMDIKEMRPHLEKLIALFNNLPKNGHTHYPKASLVAAEDVDDFWKNNAIIIGKFIPSYAYSKTREDNKLIGFNFNTDGTARFKFYFIEDAENFPELFKFNGTWKEAYLLTVKTLQKGWPQTKFPEEFESFLKK